MRRRFIVQPWMILLGLLVLLIISMAVTFAVTDRQNTALENSVGAVVAPLQDGATKTTNAVSGFFARLFATRDVDKEYSQLKDRVSELETENSMMSELTAENERLTQLLGLTEQYPQYEFIHASVSARDPGSWFMTFQINCGTNQGVDVDMAVVNQDGLVGRIIEAGPNWARVLTIIDTQSAVSAIVERTRDHGIVEGSTDPEAKVTECTVQYLPMDSDLAPGDRLITSNLGGIFPKGIVVGMVTEVNRDQNSQSYAIIRPTVDFAHLEDVLVIKGDKDDSAQVAAQEGEDGVG